MACWIDGVKQRPSETVFLFSDSLLDQTLRSEYMRSAHILPVEFRFHMGYGLLISDDLFNLVEFSTQPTHLI